MRDESIKPRVISTDAGTLTLSSPTPEILETLGKWPEGVQVKTCDQKLLVEITLGNENYEVRGLKMNFIGYSEDSPALGAFKLLRVLLPFALRPVANNFNGILLPCAYTRDREAGYVLFGRTFEQPAFLAKYLPLRGFDTLFGVRGGEMVTTFLTGAVRACQALKLQPRVDFDFETKSYCGTTAFDLMLVGPNVISLKPEVNEVEDIWKAVVAAGIDEVFHLPVSS